MGIQAGNSTSKTNRTAELVGHCCVCKNGIFTSEKWVRIRRPSTGKCHVGCVPSGAVLAEVTAS